MPTRDSPGSGNVTSIVAELERRELERARAIAERMHRRELQAIVEAAELMRELESSDIDGMLVEIERMADPDAADTAGQLRCARAFRSCVRGDEAAGHAEWEAVMADHPDKAVPYVMRARWWLQNKKEPERALPDLERAVTIEPSDANAYFWRARCHEVLGDPGRALANYRRAAALQPDSMDVLHALAKTLSEHGDPGEAKTAWNRLIALAPGYVDFHLGRAGQLEAEGDFEAALLDYDRAVKLDPETHSLRFSRASLLGLVGRFAEAAEDMQRACDRAPDTPLYLRGLGEMRTRSERADLAMAPLTRALELEPSAEGFTFRARAHRALGDPASALADLDRALELDPNDKLAACERLNLLVTTFPKEDVGPRVMDEIERLALAMPDVAPFAALYATVLTARGDNEGALAALDRALASDPDVDGQIYLERATAHARLDHVQEAFDDATRAIERSPGLGAAYVARGIYRSHLEEDSTAALADLARALELNPDDLAAHYHRGELLWNVEDYAGALAERDRTIALAPGLGHVYFERTLCREMMEDELDGWREANMADYERALEHGYRDVELFVHKAIAQQEVGDLAAAVATLDAGAAEHPNEGFLYHHRADFRERLGDVAGAEEDRARCKELGFDPDAEDAP